MAHSHVTVDGISIGYRFTESASDEALEHALELLSSDETDRYNRLRSPRQRRDYAFAHALLRTELSRHVDRDPCSWDFATGCHGKPHLVCSSKVSFNLSHANGIVACVVGVGADVGIDVEKIERTLDIDPIVERYFSPVELAWLRLADTEQRVTRFYELWTLKEAFVKCTGAGLRDLHESGTFEVSPDGVIHFRAPVSRALEQWQYAVFAPGSLYRLAVAVNSEQVRTGGLTARLYGGVAESTIAPILNSRDPDK